MQEMIQNGVLIIGSNNLMYAHQAPELKRIFHAYDVTFGKICEAIRDNNFASVAGTEVDYAPIRNDM